MRDDEHLEPLAEPVEPLADRCGDGTADAAIDLVEDQRRSRRAAREHDLEGEHQPRQLAARRDARERAGRCAGVGRDLEADAVLTMLVPFRLGERCEDGAKARLVEAQRRQFPAHRLVEARGGAPAQLADGFGRRKEGLAGLLLALGQGGDGAAAILDRRDLAGDLRAQGGERIDGDAVLAGEGAQREEAFLDLVDIAALALALAQRRLELGDRLGRLDERARDGGERRIEPPRRLVADALEHPRRGIERVLRPLAAGGFAGELGERAGHPGDQFLAMHQRGAGLGQAILLAVLRRHRIELGESVAQIVLIRAGAGEPVDGLLPRGGGGAPALPRRGLRGQLALIAAKGVEQLAMGARIEQPVLLELALDLDQKVADLAHQPDARRRVGDEGAAAPVGAEDAAQHERAVRRHRLQPMLGEEGPDGVIGRQREFSRNHRLRRAAPHQPAFRPHPEGEAEGVEQDRFAGAGLAGEDAQARAEGELQPFDQHEVPYRQTEQHQVAEEREGPMAGMITGAPVVDQRARARRFALRARRHLRRDAFPVGIVTTTGCVPVGSGRGQLPAVGSSPVNNRENTGER